MFLRTLFTKQSMYVFPKSVYKNMIVGICEDQIKFCFISDLEKFDRSVISSMLNSIIIKRNNIIYLQCCDMISI